MRQREIEQIIQENVLQGIQTNNEQLVAYLEVAFRERDDQINGLGEFCKELILRISEQEKEIKDLQETVSELVLLNGSTESTK